MSKLVEAVRNSPLMKGKQSHGQYSPLLQQSTDPFVQGICFTASYIGSIEMVDRVGTDRNHSILNKKLDEVQRTKKDKDLPKVIIEIKAVALTLKSIKGPKSEAVYPIYTVSYCGNARDADTIFFFIFKSKKDQKIYAEVFKCSNSEKVSAINRTISKAFSIAYKAWQMKKRMQQRTGESPLLQQKMAREKDNINMTKGAVEKAAGATGGAYTPPIPRKTQPEEDQSEGRKRSDSFNKDEEAQKMAMSHLKKNPALDRMRVKNEASGKIVIPKRNSIHLSVMNITIHCNIEH